MPPDIVHRVINAIMKSIVRQDFYRFFKNTESPILKIQAPGRINLIGEHIDYNGGYVLPATIDKYLYFDFKKSNDATVRIWSEDFNEGYGFPLEARNTFKNWTRYLTGILSELTRHCPNRIKGFYCNIKSTLPIGAGISSSAALLCGFAKGLITLFNLPIDDLQLIKIAQNAERIFSGANVGVMDPFAVVKGKKDHFLLLNCDALSYQAIKSELESYTLLLLNTNVAHKLGDSAYNSRRANCEAALATLQQKYTLSKLADASLAQIDDLKDTLGEEQTRLACYVVKEQRRVTACVQALAKKDFKKVGVLLNDSHEGLSREYQVSCEPLDFLANLAKQHPQVLGARMMGGGFGGCTLNLIEKTAVKGFIESTSKAYREKFNMDLTPIHVRISDGVKIIS